MLRIVWNLGSLIIALSLLITAHEFGHFLIARYYGVRIERFSIGFGKEIWKRIDRYGTEFVIALIPLGGYIKMLDGRVKSITPGMYQYAFDNKKINQRAFIISAGPLTNFIFAIFAYWIVFIIGIPSDRPIVGEIIPNSIAENAHIIPGMEIKAIDGIETPDWDTARLELIAKIGNSSTILSVLPSGSHQKEEKILNLRNWIIEPNKQDPVFSLGMYPRNVEIKAILTKVEKNSSANKAGLQIGDKITQVNGQPLTEWVTFINLVHDNPGKPLALVVERRNMLLPITLIPDKKYYNGKLKGFVGVAPTVLPLSINYESKRQYNPIIAIFKAINKTWKLIKLTMQVLGKLIIGDIEISNFSGPISMAYEAGKSAEFGIIYYLMFLALISVNLGVFNLLPLPVLDGGHLLFLVIEKLKGSAVSERIQNISYRIGSILLLLLMGIAIFNDISRL